MYEREGRKGTNKAFNRLGREFCCQQSADSSTETESKTTKIPHFVPAEVSFSSWTLQSPCLTQGISCK